MMIFKVSFLDNKKGVEFTLNIGAKTPFLAICETEEIYQKLPGFLQKKVSEIELKIISKE